MHSRVVTTNLHFKSNRRLTVFVNTTNSLVPDRGILAHPCARPAVFEETRMHHHGERSALAWHDMAAAIDWGCPQLFGPEYTPRCVGLCCVTDMRMVILVAVGIAQLRSAVSSMLCIWKLL